MTHATNPVAQRNLPVLDIDCRPAAARIKGGGTG
jgi:hypothetical protein